MCTTSLNFLFQSWNFYWKSKNFQIRYLSIMPRSSALIQVINKQERCTDKGLLLDSIHFVTKRRCKTQRQTTGPQGDRQWTLVAIREWTESNKTCCQVVPIQKLTRNNQITNITDMKQTHQIVVGTTTVSSIPIALLSSLSLDQNKSEGFVPPCTMGAASTSSKLWCGETRPIHWTQLARRQGKSPGMALSFGNFLCWR